MHLIKSFLPMNTFTFRLLVTLLFTSPAFCRQLRRPDRPGFDHTECLHPGHAQRG